MTKQILLSTLKIVLDFEQQYILTLNLNAALD